MLQRNNVYLPNNKLLVQFTKYYIDGHQNSQKWTHVIIYFLCLPVICVLSNVSHPVRQWFSCGSTNGGMCLLLWLTNQHYCSSQSRWYSYYCTMSKNIYIKQNTIWRWYFSLNWWIISTDRLDTWSNFQSSRILMLIYMSAHVVTWYTHSNVYNLFIYFYPKILLQTSTYLFKSY